MKKQDKNKIDEDAFIDEIEFVIIKYFCDRGIKYEKYHRFAIEGFVESLINE